MEVAEPQVGAVTVSYVAAQVPLLSTTMLADTAAEAVDSRTVKYFLQDSLKKKKKKNEEEEEEGRRRRKEWEEEHRSVRESLERAQRIIHDAAASLHPLEGKRRKRKKRRNKKLPKSGSRLPPHSGPSQFPQIPYWSDNRWKACLAAGGGAKRRYQYCTDDSGTIVYFRALQGHSGRNLIDPSLQDNVVIQSGFFHYIGCAFHLHSIMNNGLIPGGQN